MEKECKDCKQIPHSELRAALWPFAKMGSELRGDDFHCLYEITGTKEQRVKITMAHLKKAQAVLGMEDAKE